MATGGVYTAAAATAAPAATAAVSSSEEARGFAGSDSGSDSGSGRGSGTGRAVCDPASAPHDEAVAAALAAIHASVDITDLIDDEAAHWEARGCMAVDRKGLAASVAQLLDLYRAPLASLFIAHCTLCSSSSSPSSPSSSSPSSYEPIHHALTISGTDFLMLCLGLGLVPREHSAAGFLVTGRRISNFYALGSDKERLALTPSPRADLLLVSAHDS
jgi:hypothetical protein